MNFKISNSDARLIAQIVERAFDLMDAVGSPRSISRMELSMDLTACHVNGTPLRLTDLLAADDTNFAHGAIIDRL